MLELTSAKRSELRSQAHALDPVVIVGDAGLTPAVLKEIDSSLQAHELIKIRVFGDDRAARIEVYNTICQKLNAAPVQHIGKLLVVYRPKPDSSKAFSTSSSKSSFKQSVVHKVGKNTHTKSSANTHKGHAGLREVVIVKPSASGTKRPSVTKVMLKGNERVTAGGLIKRAKPRQTSSKKPRV